MNKLKGRLKSRADSLFGTRPLSKRRHLEPCQGVRALKEFGALLARTVRQDDLAARFGGEEFVLLIRSASLHTAVLVAERLRSSVMNLHIPATAHTLTASFGVVQLSSNGDINQAIEQADRLLYEAKHAGRNKVIWKAS